MRPFRVGQRVRFRADAPAFVGQEGTVVPNLRHWKNEPSPFVPVVLDNDPDRWVTWVRPEQIEPVT